VDARGEHEPVRVTFTDGDGLPSFSPDGQRLTWTSTRGADGRSQIFWRWNDAAARQAIASAPKRNARGTNWGGVNERAGSANELFRREHVARRCVRTWAIASEKLEGRMTGSQGARLASEFIAEQLRGRITAWRNNSFFSRSIQRRRARGRTRIASRPVCRNRVDIRVGEDFRPLSFTATARCPAKSCSPAMDCRCRQGGRGLAHTQG
jgi:hypothetical protein